MYCRNGTTPLLRCLRDPFVTNTPWSQGPFSSPGGAVVVHRVDTGAFVVPHVRLRSWLDNFVNAGELRSAEYSALLTSLER